MVGLMRPSPAGPMLAREEPVPTAHESSAGLLLWKCATPPIEKTFLAHASGLDCWVPVLLWLCVQQMSWSKMMSSASAENEL